MNATEKNWLENRIQAAIADDFYLDRDEEKRIKEEGSAKGIAIKDIELVVRAEMDTYGAVSERALIDELSLLLHQFTDSDKELDGREERNALDKVLAPARGKKAGLDPRVAEEYVHSFCRVNGVRRNTDAKRWVIPVVAIGLVFALGLGGYYWIRSGASATSQVVVKTEIIDGNKVLLNDADKAEIDDQLRRANMYVEKAQYTDPPEKSAKASLDTIRQIDSKGQYRGSDVHQLASTIVGHYLDLAEKSQIAGDQDSVSRWISRAKLMNVDVELIRERERLYGLLSAEK